MTALEYDLCREEGGGMVLSIDFHGQLSPDDIDQALADISHDPEEYGLDHAPFRGFNIRVLGRRSVHPQDCDDPDNCEHDWDEWVYDATTKLSEGAVLVTQLEIDDTWPHRCYRHRDRVATTGLPADWFLDPESGDDPVPFVGDYLYVCWDCRQKIDARHEVQSRLWSAEVERRRAAGVPERLVYR